LLKFFGDSNVSERLLTQAFGLGHATSFADQTGFVPIEQRNKSSFDFVMVFLTHVVL
jgi:hypothetical protein